MSKEATFKKLFNLFNKLQNEFKIPLLFTYYSKLGIVPFGSENLVTKFRDKLGLSCAKLRLS